MPATLAHEDLPQARGLLIEIAGHCWHGKGDMIDRVHVAIAKRFSTWSRRRVRAIWHQECAGIRHHEMRELAQVAAAVAEERSRIEAGRAEHARFIAKTAALAARLRHQDEDFHRGNIDALRAMANGSSDLAARADCGNCAGDRPGVARP